MTENIAEKVKTLIAKQLGKDVKLVTDKAKIVEDLSADSLDVVEMLMTLEDDFGITIPDEDAMNLKTVGDIVAFVQKNI